MFLWKTLIKLMWLHESLQTTRPTNDISIEFEIQWNFVMLLFITHSANHLKKFAHLCQIWLWSVEHILNQSTPKFHRISNSIEILLGGYYTWLGIW